MVPGLASTRLDGTKGASSAAGGRLAALRLVRNQSILLRRHPTLSPRPAHARPPSVNLLYWRAPGGGLGRPPRAPQSPAGGRVARARVSGGGGASEKESWHLSSAFLSVVSSSRAPPRAARPPLPQEYCPPGVPRAFTSARSTRDARCLGQMGRRWAWASPSLALPSSPLEKKIRASRRRSTTSRSRSLT